MRFWDSSAVVPLLVAQRASDEADAWLAEDDEIVVWTLTPVEVASALRRLVREGSVRERDALEAERRADELLRVSHAIVDVEGVKAAARRLLRVHPLRAADALQLAAARLWAGEDPGGRVIHTLDQRLAAAALREGFRVVPEPP